MGRACLPEQLGSLEMYPHWWRWQWWRSTGIVESSNKLYSCHASSYLKWLILPNKRSLNHINKCCVSQSTLRKGGMKCKNILCLWSFFFSYGRMDHRNDLRTFFRLQNFIHFISISISTRMYFKAPVTVLKGTDLVHQHSDSEEDWRGGTTYPIICGEQRFCELLTSFLNQVNS